MHPILRLYEDILSNDAPEVGLPAHARLSFVVHGSVACDGGVLGDGEVWHGEGAVWLKPGQGGATLWRFELAPGNASEGALVGEGVVSRLKLAAPLATLPKGA